MHKWCCQMTAACVNSAATSPNMPEITHMTMQNCSWSSCGVDLIDFEFLPNHHRQIGRRRTELRCSHIRLQRDLDMIPFSPTTARVPHGSVTSRQPRVYKRAALPHAKIHCSPCSRARACGRGKSPLGRTLVTRRAHCVAQFGHLAL